MKITIYELLGLVKDNKAPKKIKYDDRIFEFDELEEQYCYHNDTYTINEDLNCHIDGLRRTILNDKAEIIEEEKEVPEKITIKNARDFTIDGVDYFYGNRDSIIEPICIKINEIIDYLKSKESDK